VTVFNPTIAGITVRGLLGRKRSLLLIPLPLVLLFLTAVARTSGVAPKDWADAVLVVLGVGVVMPLTALIIGTSVFGSEIDDGTIVHVLTKPLPRREVVLTKYLVATGISALVSAVSLLAAGIITGSLRLGIGLAVGGVVGTIVYTALFVMASLLIRRSVLIGLAYILLWENLLGSLLSGTRVLSVQQYALTIADRISGSPLLTSHVSLPTSIGLCAAFTAVALLLSIDRLRSFSLAGETS
jgi:ABC-2 type transport system permease protein